MQRRPGAWKGYQVPGIRLKLDRSSSVRATAPDESKGILLEKGRGALRGLAGVQCIKTAPRILSKLAH